MTHTGYGYIIQRNYPTVSVPDKETSLPIPSWEDTRYNEPQWCYGSEESREAFYSDRLSLWSKDYSGARKRASERVPYENSIAWWEALSAEVLGHPVTIVSAKVGLNLSNGYHYYVFFTSDPETRHTDPTQKELPL